MKICNQCKAVLGQSAEACPADGATPEEVHTLPPGATLGAYRIVGELGDGGMGVVYEAVHEVLGRRSALKLLRPEYAKNEEVVTRFLQEAKAVNLISNRHIVNVYDYGDDIAGLVYFVMEYLEGGTLADVMATYAPMPSELFCHIFLQVLQGLAAAHENQIVHRDLKFENVFVIAKAANPLYVKLLDFGVAKLRGEHSVEGLTQAGRLIGTPRFMSPEQFRGKAVDARSDVFSLGIMMYAAATGHMPFADGDLSDLATGIIKEQQTPASEREPSVPKEISDFIDKALEKEASARFPNARAMQTQLAAIRDALDPDSSKITAFLREHLGDPHADVGAIALTPPPADEAPSPSTAAPRPEASSVSSRRGLAVGIGAVGLGAVAALVMVLRGGDSGASQPSETPAEVASSQVGPSQVAESALTAAVRAQAGDVGTLATERMRSIWDASKPSARRELVEALGQVGGPAAAPLLLRALGDAPTTALVAANALAEHSDASTQDAVAEALDGASTQLRLALAEALERNGDERGRGALSALMNEPRHRTAAALAFGSGTAGEAVASILRDVYTETPAWKGHWLAAAEVLAAGGDADAKAALLEALNAESTEQQVSAAAALARGGHAEGLTFLADIAADARSDQRGAAALLLAKQGHEDAALFVPVGLLGDDVGDKIVAIAVLSRLGGAALEKQAERLAKAAESEQPAVAMAALTAIANMADSKPRDE